MMERRRRGISSELIAFGIFCALQIGIMRVFTVLEPRFMSVDNFLGLLLSQLDSNQLKRVVAQVILRDLFVHRIVYELAITFDKTCRTLLHPAREIYLAVIGYMPERIGAVEANAVGIETKQS